MTLWAIVPVKPLRMGKVTVGRGFIAEERKDLNSSLLTHTLETLTKYQKSSMYCNQSRSGGFIIGAISRCATVQENGTPELNIALAALP